MKTFRGIHWDDEDARLKTFSATSKAGAVSIVKIEIEVRTPFRLSMLLEALDEIHREQDAIDRRPATPTPRRRGAREAGRQIGNQPPLLLTYRKD